MSIDPVCDLSALRGAVQTNCHISDARHAREQSLCIYLMRMREHYRWEMGCAYADSLPHSAVGAWLSEREQLWQELETAEYRPLCFDEARFDPFDSETANAVLLTQGLVYSGGYGLRCRPHFFLGELAQQVQCRDYRVIVSAQEFARDVGAPTAMAQGATIYVRRESLARLIWEKVEESRWQKTANPMGRAMAHYPFDTDVDAAVAQMCEHQLAAVIAHEVGELHATRELGEPWNELLVELAGTRAELAARAVRDHLADCVSTLPLLLAEAQEPLLHFYFANLKGMRRSLFPALLTGYRRWLDGAGIAALREPVVRGREHWLSLAQRLLAQRGKTADELRDDVERHSL